MSHLVKARHHGCLVDIVFAALKQLITMLQLQLAHIFLGSHTCQCLYLAIEGAMTHSHAVSKEGHINVLAHDVVVDDSIQLLKEFAIEATQFRGERRIK